MAVRELVQLPLFREPLDQRADEGLDRGCLLLEYVPGAEAAAEVDGARHPAEVRPTLACEGRQPGDGRPYSRRLEQLRADVHVQAGDLEARGAGGVDRLEGVFGRQPELRAAMAGRDRSMRLCLDPGGHADQYAFDSCHGSPRNLVYGVDDDVADAGRCSRGKLLVALVVPVEHDAVSRNARAERERELAGRGDVGAVAGAGDELEDRNARKGLDAVEQERVGGRAAIRLDVREERLLAVDDERRAELLGEARRPDATERELAVLSRGRVREELECRQ